MTPVKLSGPGASASTAVNDYSAVPERWYLTAGEGGQQARALG